MRLHFTDPTIKNPTISAALLYVLRSDGHISPLSIYYLYGLTFLQLTVKFANADMGIRMNVNKRARRFHVILILIPHWQFLHFLRVSHKIFAFFRNEGSIKCLTIGWSKANEVNIAASSINHLT